MSEPDLVPRWNVRVPMRDGVELSADIWRPAGDDPKPALMSRTPYNKTSDRSRRVARWWAQHGYPFVYIDVRGRGDSDGAFTPYRNDGPDGHDAIEWVAAQPWCSGKVVTFGGSYGGRIQWLAALEKPPSLAAMIVHVCPSDPYVEWPTGTHGPMMLSWFRMVDGRLIQPGDDVDWMKIYEHLPLVELDEAAGFSSSAWREDLEHPTLDAYWRPMCYQDRYDEVDVPVLHVSGWYDDEAIGTPRNFAGMSASAPSERARSTQALLMGPWGHNVHEPKERLGEVDFGPESVIDLRAYEKRWLDGVLNGATTGVPRVRLFVMGANEWRDYDSWPPPGRVEAWHLHSGGNANSRFGDGVLATDAPGDEPPDSYDYDPARPVPYVTDLGSAQIGGPDDYSAIEQRGDVLVYSSPVLESDLEVIGAIRCVLFASSSTVDTDFMAKLIDVHPGGLCLRLCDGMVRGRFREGMEREVLMEPGEPYRFEIVMWDTCHVFKAGHRVRLEIASSAFPKYDRNLNTGESLATGTRMAVARNTVLHDAAHPSHLLLPVTG
jgi:putative CocE/NonD family hydrolase